MTPGQMRRAIDALDLPPPRKAVLKAIATHADDTGAAYPSVHRVAALTGYSRRTVFRALAALEADGWISRTRRADPRRGFDIENLYLVSVQRLAEFGSGDRANAAIRARRRSIARRHRGQGGVTQ